ncbi:Similar to DBR1: Lariat debranching enzyme (Drosophila pseudoobscura pseudoobscura) [Cotesia congregata]|uniref:Similar to DBR1: Lariat debranching enzyme (Drosophila pseudoobscura pseudoobscura) n=1 Tax=Cotesia congregata TaxID=51543 RepID=A0A8J2H5K1_COTCN|nr:Similar to DBR1: Lariat debranching enzyme (Drosophila pseudoobscura pseudoobscura) [Cotesia congregata]
MRIAVEGCAHGELEIIYDILMDTEKSTGKKVDLLVCCGEKTAPVLTIFIGGNHEASNYLQELPYGGWVAPNIYYMGYAGVLNVGGIRIAGISGIFKAQDLLAGHFEQPPYNGSTIRSVYHIRNLEVFRLKQLSGNIDIFLSHDWPCGITKYGNEKKLLRFKKYFQEDVENNALGSPPGMELLKHHYPSYWFAAHLHCKFAALVPNENRDKVTKFLALDKCLPKRKFLQILDIPHDETQSLSLSYDIEWLSVLFLTNYLLSVKNTTTYMPGPGGAGRWNFTPTEAEKNIVLEKFNDDLKVPLNFERENELSWRSKNLPVNNQTKLFCEKLGIDDPSELIKLQQSRN